MNANVLDEDPTPIALRHTGGGKPQNPQAPPKATSAAWLMPAALIMLVAIPLAAGTFRLTQLAGGAEITPANARFFASPLPVVLHIVSAGVYAILGAFQFAPAFRGAGPAGIARPGGCWLSAACWSGFPGCG